MTDASLELQGAIVAALKAAAAVTGLVGPRVYDVVPADAAFPYVSLGPDQVLSDDAECIRGYEISIQIDAWSRAIGFPEVKRIAGAIRDALHDQDIPLVSNALVSIEHRQTRTLRDPDGVTSHAVIEFTALVEAP